MQFLVCLGIIVIQKIRKGESILDEQKFLSRNLRLKETIQTTLSNPKLHRCTIEFHFIPRIWAESKIKIS